MSVLINPSIATREGVGAVVRLRRQRGEVPPTSRGVGVVSTQAVLMEAMCALKVGAGAEQVTLVTQDEGEVVEALGGVGVVGAEALLADTKERYGTVELY